MTNATTVTTVTAVTALTTIMHYLDVDDVGAASHQFFLRDLSHRLVTPTPLSQGRIRKIVKLDNDVKNIGKEAIVAITKATELFIAYLVRMRPN